jgi:hypothetical protein
MHAYSAGSNNMKLKLLLLLLAVSTAFGAEWDALRKISSGRKIEIITRDGRLTRASFVSVAGDVLAFRENSGERSLTRVEIRQVRIFDPGRRVRKGLLWTAVGAAAGAGAGLAACPYCPNEGHTSTYVGPGAAIGAGIGALGFLSSPYQIVYKSK